MAHLICFGSEPWKAPVKTREEILAALLKNNVPKAKRTSIRTQIFTIPGPSEPLSTTASDHFRWGQLMNEDCSSTDRTWFFKRDHHSEYNEARARYALPPITFSFTYKILIVARVCRFAKVHGTK